MPVYPGTANSKVRPLYSGYSISKGEQFVAFNAETPAAGTASDRVALGLGPVEGYPQSISVEGFFSGDPGVFEVDIQDADTDADAFYQTIPAGGVIAAVATTVWTFRAELVPIKARFVRLLLKTRTNSVALTATVTR